MQTMVTPTLGGGADATVNENANSVPWWKTPGGGGNGMRLLHAHHRKQHVYAEYKSRDFSAGPLVFIPAIPPHTPPGERELVFSSGSGGCAGQAQGTLPGAWT